MAKFPSLLVRYKMRDLFGNPHIISPCIASDVTKHFNKIEHYIPAAEHKEFVERMQECVVLHTAFRISDDCFLYYKNVDKFTSVGVALCGRNVPLEILTLFAGVFTLIDQDTFVMRFALHPGKLALEYKTLISLTSIRRNFQDKSPLVVRIDKLRDKLSKLYTIRGIPWDQS